MSCRINRYKGQFMPSPQADPVNAENSSSGKRLDAWKEIAVYLRRGERTVKRWEVERGLPIHRVPGSGRASVYAYTSELDEWLRSSRSSDLETADVAEAVELPEDSGASDVGPDAVADVDLMAEPDSRRENRQRSWLLAAAVVLLIGAAITVLGLSAPRAAGRLSAALPALFGRSQPKPASATTPVVSDAERRLAHDFYLKGRYEWGQRTPDSLNHAVDSFTQSIVHDPGNAQAYVGLADSYDLLEVYSNMPETDAYPRAIAAAKKAVELDGSLAEAHRALAFAEFYGAWDFADSEREFLRAIQLDPKDPVTRRWYANAFAVPGRFAESLAQFDKAQELDPASPSTLSDKGNILFEAGKKEEGIALMKEVERTDPGFYSPHFYLMMIDLESHNDAGFLDEGQKAADIKDDPVLKDAIASARAGYARDGERGLLQGLYASQRKSYEEGKLHGAMLAITCVLMGRKQEAVQLLETAYARHEMDALWCLAQPELLTLKADPKYQAVVRKFNFPVVPAVESPGVPPAGDNSPVRASSLAY
jgi:tetratricopeptide (TPR) repeat protein